MFILVNARENIANGEWQPDAFYHPVKAKSGSTTLNQEPSSSYTIRHSYGPSTIGSRLISTTATANWQNGSSLTACLDVADPQSPEIANVKPAIGNYGMRKRVLQRGIVDSAPTATRIRPTTVRLRSLNRPAAVRRQRRACRASLRSTPTRESVIQLSSSRAANHDFAPRYTARSTAFPAA